MKKLRVLDTPSKGEVIAVFEHEDKSQTNVTITNETLQLQLRETPPTIPNPAYVALTDTVFALAQTKVAEITDGK